jgi:hypothetical protein
VITAPRAMSEPAAAPAPAAAGAPPATQEPAPTRAPRPDEATEPEPESAANTEREPRLKYEHLGGGAPAGGAPAATALAASAKLLALGDSAGGVRLLDASGREVRALRPHAGAVADLGFDAAAEHLVSAAADGSLAATPLYEGGGGAARLRAGGALTSACLDPRYSSRKTKELFYGSATGALVLASRGWLGAAETVLFRGRGPVLAVRAAGPLLAWATATGVRVYDTSDHSRVGRADAPPGAAAGGGACALRWARGGRELLVAWGAAVEVLAVAPAPEGASAAAATPPPGGAPPPADRAPPARWALRSVARFQLGGGALAAGAAPFGTHLAVLAWRAPAADGADGAAWLKIFNRAGAELASDSLDLPPSSAPPRLAAHLVDDDAPLLLAPPTLSSNDGRDAEPAASRTPSPECEGEQAPRAWWRGGAEPHYYVLGGGVLLAGRPRDAADRVAWLSERSRFEEALAAADAAAPGELPPAARAALGEAQLAHLFKARRYAAAAAAAPRALGADAAAWERWAFAFGQAARLPALAPRLPVDPRLPPAVYDLALGALLNSPADHEALLALAQAWPPGAYDAAALLARVAPRARAAGAGAALRRAAAELHGRVGDRAAALGALLALRDPGALDYAEAHALLPAAARRAAALFAIDARRAAALLAAGAEEAPPAAVIASLEAALAAAERREGGAASATPPAAAGDVEGDAVGAADGAAAAWRARLLAYLDALSSMAPAAAAPHAGRRLALTAELAPARLLDLLASDAPYPLEEALAVCEARGLARESVFVLGRMGAAERALRVIVERLRDVGQAVDFVQERADAALWELLVALALADAELAGALLDRAGGCADPARVVAALPRELPVERLRARLARVVADYRAQVGLAAGAAAVLRADVWEMGERLYAGLRRAAAAELRVRAPGAARWDRAGSAGGAGGGDAGSGDEGGGSPPASPRLAGGVWVGFAASAPPPPARPSPSKFPPRRAA